MIAVAGLIALIIIASFLLVGAGLHLLTRCSGGTISTITWKDLEHDFVGNGSSAMFENGIFLSYDDPEFPQSNPPKPSTIVILDRIVGVSYTHSDGIGPSYTRWDETHFGLESTLVNGSAQGGPVFKGRPDAWGLGDYGQGDLVVIRMSVLGRVWDSEEFRQWYAETLMEYLDREQTFAPSILSHPDPRVCYAHSSPLHDTPRGREPFPKFNPRLVAHAKGDDNITLLRMNGSSDQMVLRLGAYAPGQQISHIPAAFGVVNEGKYVLEAGGAEVRGKVAAALRVSFHNHTDKRWFDDGGLSAWDGKTSSNLTGLELAPGDVDLATAGNSRPTVDPVSRVPALRQTHNATATDMVWVEIDVQVPLGTLEGTYYLEIVLWFKVSSLSRESRYLAVHLIAILGPG